VSEVNEVFGRSENQEESINVAVEKSSLTYLTLDVVRRVGQLTGSCVNTEW
jgi:hypothetical protein